VADPLELAGASIGGITVGGLLVGLVKAMGSRNISALDKTLADLAAAVTGLAKEVQAMREAHIALAKDVGAVQKDMELLRQRVDGLAEHWREQFEEHRRLVHDRMAEATRAMISTAETAVEQATKGRKPR
jgi:uncharacterized protein YoxC